MISRLQLLTAVSLGVALGVRDDAKRPSARILVVDEAHTLRIKPPPRYRETYVATSSIDANAAEREAMGATLSAAEGWPEPKARTLSETELAAQAKRDRKAAKRRAQS